MCWPEHNVLWLFSAFKIINGLQKDKYKLDSSEAAVTICHVYAVQRLFKTNLTWSLLFAQEYENCKSLCPSCTTAKAANSLGPGSLTSFQIKGTGGQHLAGTLRSYRKRGWLLDEQHLGTNPNQNPAALHEIDHHKTEVCLTSVLSKDLRAPLERSNCISQYKISGSISTQASWSQAT